jgi:Rv0078B-related antitoxin
VDATGAGDRLRTALELFEFGVAMQRQRFRRERPAASDAEIDDLLRSWMLTPSGAATGDCSAYLSLRPL